MMRPIKFRAWDGKNMYSIKSINNISHNGEIDVATALKKGIPVTLRSCHGHKFMQYTGLEDRNGKEIYEGDILKYESEYEDQELYIVKWHDDDSMFVPKKINGNWFCKGSRSAWVAFYKEVIGNIYENPELI